MAHSCPLGTVWRSTRQWAGSCPDRPLDQRGGRNTLRRMRGTALAAVAMAGVLTLAGCAKDSGGGNSSNNTAASSGGGSDCVTAQKPPAAPAASSSTAAAGGKVDGSKLKIGLAFDVGGRGDASFNDAA